MQYMGAGQLKVPKSTAILLVRLELGSASRMCDRCSTADIADRSYGQLDPGSPYMRFG